MLPPKRLPFLVLRFYVSNLLPRACFCSGVWLVALYPGSIVLLPLTLARDIGLFRFSLSVALHIVVFIFSITFQARCSPCSCTGSVGSSTFFQLHTFSLQYRIPRSALSIGAWLICLQEPFLGNKNIAHSALNFYRLGGVRSEARVLTAVKKDLVNKITVENRSDLVDHPYFLALDIRDIDRQLNKPTRRTRVINVYDNRVGQGCTWVGHTSENRRALEDILWDRVIRGRVLILGE